MADDSAAQDVKLMREARDAILKMVDELGEDIDPSVADAARRAILNLEAAIRRPH